MTSATCPHSHVINARNLTDFPYDQVWDAFYCGECGQWLTPKCSDPECYFCTGRPKSAFSFSHERIARW
jgi:hypothetical protein